MNHHDFIRRRANSLAQELGSVSLARIALEAHEPRAVLKAIDLLSAWLTRDLTDREFVALRQAADDLGVDLAAFDQVCAQQEKGA